MLISSRVPPWDSMRFEARRTDWHLLLLGRHRSPGSRGVEGCATKACSTEEHWTLNKITSDHIGSLDITMKFVFPSDMCRTSFLNAKYRSRFSCGWRPGNANGFGWSIVLNAYVLRHIDAMSCKFPHFRRQNSRSLSKAFCKSTCVSWPFVSMSFVHLCSFSSLAQPLQFRTIDAKVWRRFADWRGAWPGFSRIFYLSSCPLLACVGITGSVELGKYGTFCVDFQGGDRSGDLFCRILLEHWFWWIQWGSVGFNWDVCTVCTYHALPLGPHHVFSEVNDSSVNTWWRERPERIWPICKLMHFNRVVGLSWYSWHARVLPCRWLTS